MKDGIQQLLGKRIKAAIVAESPTSPRTQMFLVFTDDTSFEFYGNEFSGAGRLDQRGIENVRRYISQHPEARITAEYIVPASTP